MNRSEHTELVLQAEAILEKAFAKYEGVITELKAEEGYENSNLAIALNDSLKNLHRKVDAFLSTRIDIYKLVDEFVFEKEIISDELRAANQDHVQLKRFAKRLLISVEDFIEKTPLKRKGLKRIKRNMNPNIYAYEKSKKTAYLLWLFGFFGALGLHRFYMGKIGSGLGWFFTGGVFGIGSLYDLFTLSAMVDEHNALADIKERRFKQLQENNPQRRF